MKTDLEKVPTKETTYISKATNRREPYIIEKSPTKETHIYIKRD